MSKFFGVLARFTRLFGQKPLSKQPLFLGLQSNVHELEGEIRGILDHLQPLISETEGQTKAINRIEHKQNRMVEVLQIGRAVKLDSDSEEAKDSGEDKAVELLKAAGITYPFPNSDGPVNVNNLRPGDETL